jgi:hypothetical protein
LRYFRVLFSLVCMVSLLSVAQAGFAQAAQPAPAQQTLPDAPQVQVQPRVQPQAGEEFPAFDSQSPYSTSLVADAAQDQQDKQAQQNPPDPGKKDDTLKKPIYQNPVPTRDPQTKRILGLIPNFRSVSTDEKLPPMTVKQKFLTATDDSFDYSSIFIPALLAAYSMGENATPEFGQGAVGYGRYFWHSALDQTSENYMVEFIFPAITHEDNRFYTLGRGGFFKRTGYALSRAVITRNDAGNDTFNISEVVGSGASSGLSSLYYPTRERSFSNTGSEWAIDIGIDAASFVAKEFWPDINRKFFHQSDAIQGSSH